MSARRFPALGQTGLPVSDASGSKRVLFFAEAVTLAHVARPIVLARALLPTSLEPVMACSPRYRRFYETEPWQTLPLNSIPSEQFLKALSRGRPVYDLPTLRDYVAEDLRLIDIVKPDLIVGDFRLSLSVSARLAGVPYATVTNAYWSPYIARKDYPLPVLPITRLLPLPLADTLFRLASPIAFTQHCKPLNRVRREHGLPELGDNLRRIYTDADFTLYADTPAMFPTEPLPSNHQFLGPITWSPPVPLPPWWNALPDDGRPIIYVTLGSSGSAKLTLKVIEALAELPVTVIVSMAGARPPSRTAANVFTADYLPGTDAAARSQLVVCNGGSLASYQALTAGVPVLGIASNMDQFLNMGAVQASGGGAALRADRLRRHGIREAVQRLISKSIEGKSAAFNGPELAAGRFSAFSLAQTT